MKKNKKFNLGTWPFAQFANLWFWLAPPIIIDVSTLEEASAEVLPDEFI